MKAKTFVYLVETICGVQSSLTGCIVFFLINKILGLYLFLLGGVFLLGGLRYLCDLKYGKGNWEEKEL